MSMNMNMNISNLKEKEAFEKFFFSNLMCKNSSLLFSIEQWELTRRLRNSGISKEMLCQAFDELEKMEKDLGNLYDIPITSSSGSSGSNVGSGVNSLNMTSTNGLNGMNNYGSNTNHANSISLASTSNSSTGNMMNKSDFFAKNFQMLLSKSQNHSLQQPKSNAGNPYPNLLNANANGLHANSNGTNNPIGFIDTSAGAISSSNAAGIVNNYFATVIDPETENKEVEDFRGKGEVVVHSEISFFVYKHDLKQSQIARMAGVNQAYVSKFLRGEFFDLSENGKTLIYKWYLRFLKNPTIYLQAHNITLTSSEHLPKSIKMESQDSQLGGYASSFANVTNTTYDTPNKRTRFSFKSEHLVILEKTFIENQYPDQKKREELARLCNEARPCPDREKVTEQIITHWFQNKRKITRKSTTDDNSTSKDLNDFIDDPNMYKSLVGSTQTNLTQRNANQNCTSKSNEEDSDEDEDEDEIIY